MPPNRDQRSLWDKLQKKIKKMRASKNDAAPAAPDIAPQTTELNNSQLIQHGRLFATLILQASTASGIDDISKIQFNFCLQDATGKPLLSPASKEIITRCIREYLLYGNPEHQLSSDEISKITTSLRSISESSPSDSTALHNYNDTLKLRGQSFHDAGKVILENTGLSPDEMENAKASIQILRSAFERELQQSSSPEKQQACYDGYMQALAAKLVETTGLSESVIEKNLKEVETIVNIQERKAHVTFSGKVDNKNGVLCGDNIHVQMDEPCNRFSDFSKAQQQEWKDVYRKYQAKGNNAEYPKWFANRTDIEQKIWMGKMREVMAGNENVHMGPVVKKQGFPGLRNLALTSFATVKVNDHGRAEIKDVSAKSVRSSNLVSQIKDGTRNLNADQKKLTQQNIEQVSEIYQNNKIANQAGGFSYQETNRKPFVLCQTLVRKIGGGDDHVIKNKNAAIKAVNKLAGNDRVFGSNHCIGTPAKISKAFHLGMHLAGANTTTMDHIENPVKEFMENAVMNSDNVKMLDQEGLRKLYQDALQGKLRGSVQDNFSKHEISPNLFTDEQSKTLDRALQATNMYANETGSKTSFNKTHQLHMAALEEIIYQDTGNCVQSSCKSGKDREGVKINYRNAMLAFYAEHGCLAPSSNKNEPFPGAREKFVEIFVELFKTHHQARLAELNAKGCEGQKALSNILPKDIIKELKKDEAGRNLLNMHKRNSALNDMGHSSVEADCKELERVKEVYASPASRQSLRAG